MAKERTSNIAVWVGIILIVCGGFSPAISGYFHADDWFHLLTPVNAQWWSTFAGDWFTGEAFQGGLYRPLIRLSIVIDKALFGLNAWGYHLTNILFHLINVVLVLFICRALFPKKENRNFWYLTALLFGLFPFHHQAVYWISGRTDVIAATFCLASILCALQFRRKEKSSFLVYSFLLYVLALLTKEIAISLTPILILIFILIRPEENDSSGTHTGLSLKKNAPAVIALAVGTVYLIARRLIIGAIPLEKILNPFTLLSTYSSFFSFLYMPWRNSDPEFSSAIFMLQIAAPLVVLILCRGKQFTRQLILLVWVLISIAPMSGFGVSQSDGHRLLYFPSTGWFVFWIFGIKNILFRLNHQHIRQLLIAVFTTALIILAAVFGILSLSRSMTWLEWSHQTREVVTKSITMLERLKERDPEFSVALVNTLPEPRVKIFSPLKALNGALWTLGDPSWDVTIYFNPGHQPPHGYAFIIGEDATVDAYRVRDVEMLEWSAKDIAQTWRIEAPYRLNTTGELPDRAGSTLLEIAGENLNLLSPEFTLSTGWVLLELDYRVDNEELGTVMWRSKGQSFSGQGMRFLFNDVGGRFERRSVPIGYVQNLTQLSVLISPRAGTVGMGTIIVRSFILEKEPVKFDQPPE